MSKTILLCVAGLFGACAACGANIALNPGFETGNFTSWTTDTKGSWHVESTGTGITAPHSGSFYADDHCLGATCISTPDSFLFQDLTTIINQTYTLTFWYDRGVEVVGKGGAPNLEELQVFWNSMLALDLAQPTSGGTDPGWVQFTVTGLTASSTSTRLEFRARQDAAHLGVDDVDVEASSAVPEPTSLALVGSALLGAGLFTKRRKRV